MSAVNDGGPAFPRDERYLGHNGMSVRDWFAGQVIAGLCANPGGPFQISEMKGWGLVNISKEGLAQVALQLADAMLVERAKGGA